jgi:hypothetical protein
MFHRGSGLGYDGVAVSLRANYSSYVDFKNLLRTYAFVDRDIGSFLINLDDTVLSLPLTMKVLAEHMSQRNK